MLFVTGSPAAHARGRPRRSWRSFDDRDFVAPSLTGGRGREDRPHTRGGRGPLRAGGSSNRRGPSVEDLSGHGHGRHRRPLLRERRRAASPVRADRRFGGHRHRGRDPSQQTDLGAGVVALGAGAGVLPVRRHHVELLPVRQAHRASLPLLRRRPLPGGLPPGVLGTVGPVPAWSRRTTRGE